MILSLFCVIYYIIFWIAGDRFKGAEAVKLIPIPVVISLLTSMALLGMNLMELDHKLRSKDKNWVILMACGFINAISSYVTFMNFEDMEKIHIVNAIAVIMAIMTLISVIFYTIIIIRHGKGKKNKYGWEV